MIEMVPRISATITLAADRSFSFFDLPPLVGQLLAQADIRVFGIDLAVEGDTIEYRTDEGIVRLEHSVDAKGVGTVKISCNTLRRGSREVGRQICYQLVRRLISRCRVAAVHWRPTRQTILPHEFRWAALADLPQRFAPRGVSMAPSWFASSVQA